MNEILEEFSYENCPYRRIRLGALDDDFECLSTDVPGYEPACNFDGRDYRTCPVFTFTDTKSVS
jgi:hypothetical protein